MKSITLKDLRESREMLIAALSLLAIGAHLALRYLAPQSGGWSEAPLFIALAVGGIPLVVDLGKQLLARNFGSDLLGGVAILTAVFLGNYLVAAIIVLMLAGGAALEEHARRRACSVLDALVRRMPKTAHRRSESGMEDVPLESISPGDLLVIYPNETCPADGEVVEGHGRMDESYLTGEPFQITKTRGSKVISGAINGDSAITIRATTLAVDSQYAKIMAVMQESEAQRPRIRRLGDQLGAIYTPIALALAGVAWLVSGDPARFLAVLVIATPCPLLISIPVAIIGSISLCARRSIIIKSASVLEQITTCRTAIFDKTGTLTYGEPVLVETEVTPDFSENDVLVLAASLEQYSKHPLARALLAASRERGLVLAEATEISEPPGQGLRGAIGGRRVLVTGRRHLTPEILAQLPPEAGGLECVVLVEGELAALLRFRDTPRSGSRSFVAHLAPRHRFTRFMIISGDRASEVRYLADLVGIQEVHAQQTPEEKLEIVRQETKRAHTLYVGDGINDAPAMMAATVGVAIGKASDVTAEAAGAVIMDNSIEKVDELLHISRRMRSIALQSACGGMALSVIGMLAAAMGYLPAISGALLQEVIDVLAILNALRAAMPPKILRDC